MASAIDKVLVVDESDANVLFWEMLLPELNVRVLKSRAGAEALQMIEKDSIPLAIVAWELSSMPGTILIQKARESRKRRHMPFLIYSKRMSDDDVSLAKSLGVSNMISLPFDRVKVREIIESVIAAESEISLVEKKLRKMEDCLAEGHPTEALKLISPDISKKGPHLARYKALVGETFFQIGNLEKALKAVEESLELDGGYLPAYYLKSRLLTVSGRHDEAIDILKILTEKSPKNIQSLLNLGSAYISADKLDDAKKTVNQISLLDPDSQSVKDVKGKIALKEGDMSLAAQLLSETQNGDEIARFYNSLGISLVAKGDYNKGIETYQSALKILSNKAKLHLLFFNMALAYRKKGDTANELSYFCESYVAEPAFEKAYASIARGLQEAKQKGLTLNSSQIGLVTNRRQRFLTENPSVAKKIKERLSKGPSNK